MDFGKSIRKNMFEYICSKYGKEYVAQISTIGTMGAKTTLKDLCRVLEIPFLEANQITKLVPDIIMDEETDERIIDVSLSDALRESGELRKWQERYPDLFRYALQLEGQWRQPGIHAAGMIISPVPVGDVLPLARNTTHDYYPAVQADMHIVEDVGLTPKALLKVGYMLGHPKDLSRILSSNEMATSENLRYELWAM